MSKTTTLDWWLRFGQIDLDRVYKKTWLQLLKDLDAQINPIEVDCPWHAETITLGDMREFQQGALAVVESLINTTPIEGRKITAVTREGLTSCRHVVCDEDRKSTAIAIALEALEKAKLESIEQICTCPECQHVFVQHTMKRKRKYCSVQCRTKSNRRLKNGSHTQKER